MLPAGEPTGPCCDGREGIPLAQWGGVNLEGLRRRLSESGVFVDEPCEKWVGWWVGGCGWVFGRCGQLWVGVAVLVVVAAVWQ